MPTSFRESHVSSSDDLEENFAMSESSFQHIMAIRATSENRPFSRSPSPSENKPFSRTPSPDLDVSDRIYSEIMSPEVAPSSIEYANALNDIGSDTVKLDKDPPRNLEDVHAALNKPRTDSHTTEQEESKYRALLRNAQESNEAFLIISVLPIIFDLLEHQIDSQVRFLPSTKWTKQEILSPKLGQPEPDFTLGLQCKNKIFQYGQAFNTAHDYHRHLQLGRDMICPLLTVEAKGDLRESRLQNRHNAACILRNIGILKHAAKLQKKSYSNRIQALTIEVTAHVLQVSCHWMDMEGHYLSAVIEEETRMLELGRVRQMTRNAIDWTKQELSRVEKELFSKLDGKATTESRKRKRSKDE